MNKYCFYQLAFLGICTFLLAASAGIACAQDTTASHATLMGWEQRTQNFMLDESHNYGGMHYNRGLFRDNLLEMSPEHEIDLMTYRYTLLDDYRWSRADEGYRMILGSLNATKFAAENSIKTTYRFDGRNALLVDGTHEENYRAERFLFRLGYEHRFKGGHHLGVEHTISDDKSDLDATVYYRLGTFEEGMVHAGITFMNWAGNVTQGLAVDSDNRYNFHYDVTHESRKAPYLLNVKLVSPFLGHFRAELLAGLQTYSKNIVSPSVDTLDFVDEKWAHYLGGLIEYYNKHFTAGLIYQRRFSKLTRQPAVDSSFDLDFNNYQYSDRGGIFATGKIKPVLRLEQWFWLERNRDRLTGQKVPDDLSPLELGDIVFPSKRIPFNFLEWRIKVKSRILYDPGDKGLLSGLEFHADYRYPQGERNPVTNVRNFAFRTVYPIVRNRNERMTLTIGYRVNRNFHFVGGISYDLDKDRQSGIGLPRITGTPTWFDGGFGRLSLRW